MTIKKAQKSAQVRGIYFDGIKKWRNNTIGYAYEIFTPNEKGFFQTDNLDSLYREIKKYPIV